MRWFTAVVATTALVACSSATGPDEPDLSLAIIQAGELELLVTVPASVTAGEEFTVVARSYGLDSCWAQGTTDLSLDVDGAVLKLYDRPPDPSAPTGCRPAVQDFDHTVSLSFASPGVKTIEVWGYDLAARETVRPRFEVTVVGS